MCTVYHNHLSKFVPGSIVCSCRHTPLKKKDKSDTANLLFFLTTFLRLIINKMVSAKTLFNDIN